MNLRVSNDRSDVQCVRDRWRTAESRSEHLCSIPSHQVEIDAQTKITEFNVYFRVMTLLVVNCFYVST